MTGCRIGRVRMKSGGASVHILPVPVMSETAASLVTNARAISEYEGLTGYFVIGFFDDGRYNLAFRIDPDGPIGPTMAPSYVADIIRRSTATREAINELFED